MIINISGTGGAGKSWLVTHIMDQYEEKIPRFVEGRKRPICYIMKKPKNGRNPDNSLMIPGHYETACGGVDTLAMFKPLLDFVYGMIRSSHSETRSVMYEGMLIESDVRRCRELHEDGLPIRVLSLDTSLSECMDSILIRRRRKDPDAGPCDIKNIELRWRQCRRRVERLRETGVDARMISRKAALDECMEVLFSKPEHNS